MEPIRLEVQSERAYPVLIGPGLLAALPQRLADEALDRQVVVVSVPPVWRAHGRALRPVLGGQPVTLLQDGERAKTLTSVQRIYDTLVRQRVDRSGTVVAFGGGVVGDVAGFAAATYLRGINVVQVPTTLLAQVDSAIGGKVGVNLPAGKNLVGAFHPPALVVCDPDVLGTLARREFRAGLYEVVKYGVIASPSLLDRLGANLDAVFARRRELLTPLIAECCRIKADVVGRDERESGPRRALNFGHTVGHALEAVTRYRRFRHGEAVAYAMLAAVRVSAERGLVGRDDEARFRDLILRLGPLPPVTDLSITDALEAITHDKKVVGRTLHFVLADGLGATTTATDVRPGELRAAMRRLGMRG